MHLLHGTLNGAAMCLAHFGRVTDIVEADGCLANVDCDGRRHIVSLALVVGATRPPRTWVGRWVSFHAGFALAAVEEEMARAIAALWTAP